MTNDLAWMRPKLAELCGFITNEWDPNEKYYFDPKKVMDDEEVFYWKPDEDVAQAIRCLEAIEKQRYWRISPHTVHIEHKLSVWGGVDIAREGGNHSLPRAICLAIASALKWEKP